MRVSDIKSDLQRILATSENSIIYPTLTRAIEILASKSGGTWNPLVGTMDICSNPDGFIVTLPREIDVVLAVSICGKPRLSRNRWFEFHLNGTGNLEGISWVWDDKGDVPVIMDIIEPSSLIAIADLKSDIDSTIQILGYDSNGKWIRTQQPDGTWIDGWIIPINLFTDFPMSIPIAPTVRFFYRNFSPSKMFNLTSSGNHSFSTGALAGLSLSVAPIPTPLINGQSYYIRVIDDNNIQLFASQSSALTNTSPIQITSASASSAVILTDTRNIQVQTKFTSSINHNFITGQLVNFAGSPIPSPILSTENYYANVIDSTNFTIHSSQLDSETGANPINVTTPGSSVTATGSQPIDPRTIFNFSTAHNFIQGDAVFASNIGGQLPSPLQLNTAYYVRVITSTQISLHSNQADATAGVNPITLTSSGSGTNAIFKTLPASAVTGTSNQITCANHNLSASDIISFTTTGTFPAPIAANTNYRAIAPLSANTFTLADLSSSAINITALGTGNLFLIISRAFTIGFTNQWRTNATEITNGIAIKLSATGSLPVCTPVISSATTYYARKISNTDIRIFESSAKATDTAARATTNRSRSSNVATLTTATSHGFTTGDRVTITGMTDSTYNATNVAITVTGSTTFTYANAGSNEGTTADTAGLIVFSEIYVNALGSGILSLLYPRSVTAELLNNFLLPNNSQYLKDKAVIQFSTSGTLPAPLATLTNYKIQVVNEQIKVLNSSTEAEIILTNIGSGNHSFAISSTFTVSLPTSFDVLNNEYSNGDAVIVRSLPNTTPTAPSPIVIGNTYFVRRISKDQIELYNSASNAQNTSSTVGRITTTNTGSGQVRLEQSLGPIIFSKIERVYKSSTKGFINVFAFDNGRSQVYTLIGYYYPDETLPSYRRIKIGQKCEGVRIAYKKRTFDITSDTDWIPLQPRQAIFSMVRSLMLRDQDFYEQADRAEADAMRYISEWQNTNQGTDVPSVQFNSDIMTNPGSYSML